MTLGQKVTQLRRERGWSQEKLAQACGIGRMTVQRVEQDVGRHRKTSLRALAQAFGVRVAYLTDGSES